MNFTLEIVVQNGQVIDVRFPTASQPIPIGSALQALDAARSAVLSVPIAQPAPQPEAPAKAALLNVPIAQPEAQAKAQVT